MTQAGRERISKAMKKRWAASRQAETNGHAPDAITFDAIAHRLRAKFDGFPSDSEKLAYASKLLHVAESVETFQ